MVNKTEKSVEFTKGIFSTHNFCRFEIIDGVKYVYCIKHAYNFFSEGTSRVCGRSLTLASMCFLLLIDLEHPRIQRGYGVATPLRKNRRKRKKKDVRYICWIIMFII